MLGVMAEVLDSQKVHREISDLCQRLGIQLLALETDLYGTGAMSLHDIVVALGNCDSDAVVLVKGSRVAATERVVQALIG